MRKLSAILITVVMMLGAPLSVSAVDVEFVSAARGDRKPPFSTAVRVDNMLYLSGALGFVEGKLAEGGAGPETTATLENIKRNLEANGSSLAQVVKCTVFLADIADFGAMNAEYVKYFPENPPARSAMAVAGLALNANVEIECMAWVD